MDKIKILGKGLGWGYLVMSSIVITYAFISAYFFGNYSVIIHINTLNEAHIELFLILACFPLSLIYLWRTAHND